MCARVSFLLEDDSCHHDVGTIFDEPSLHVYCLLRRPLFLTREHKGPLQKQLPLCSLVGRLSPTAPVLRVAACGQHLREVFRPRRGPPFRTKETSSSNGVSIATSISRLSFPSSRITFSSAALPRSAERVLATP